MQSVRSRVCKGIQSKGELILRILCISLMFRSPTFRRTTRRARNRTSARTRPANAASLVFTISNVIARVFTRTDRSSKLNVRASLHRSLAPRTGYNGAPSLEVSSSRPFMGGTNNAELLCALHRLRPRRLHLPVLIITFHRLHSPRHVMSPFSFTQPPPKRSAAALAACRCVSEERTCPPGRLGHRIRRL